MADQNRIPVEFTFNSGNFKELQAEMEKLYQKALAIQKTMTKSAATAELKKTAIATEKIAIAEQKILNAKRAVEQTAKKQAIAEKNIATASLKSATAMTKAELSAKRLNDQIKKGTKSTQGWGKAMGSFQFKFNALGNIAANVASTITNKIGRALKDTIKTVIEFEKSFAEVLTLLNKADKNKFKEVLKADSVSIMKKYGLTIKETNKAMFDAISAGVKAADVYSVLNASAKLAVGGVTDLASATKGIASVMNAFSLNMKEAENVASAFFQAQKYGITYIDDMVASMGRANTIASLSGASYREMLAAFTAITKSGLNTEEAVTGLRNIFKELVSASKEAEDALRREGIAVGAIEVQNRGFIGVLDDLNEAYKRNNEIIPEIFGNIRGLTGIMGIVGERYSTFKFVLNEVNDAMASAESLNAAVAEQMATVAKKVDILQSTWNAFWISAGDGVSDADSSIKLLIDSLIDLLEFISPDYYVKYSKAMDDARKATTKFIDEIEANAKSRASLFEDGEKAQKIYTENIIRGTKVRILAIKEETEKRQEEYESALETYNSTQSEISRLEAKSDAEYKKGHLYKSKALGVEFRKEAAKLEQQKEILDNAKVAYLEQKTMHEGLLDYLDKENQKLIDIEVEKLELAQADRERLLELLKDRKEIAIARIKIAKDGRDEEEDIEKTLYDFNKRIIKAEGFERAKENREMEKEELRHQLAMQEIKKKYGYDPTRDLADIQIKELKLQQDGYDKSYKIATIEKDRDLKLLKDKLDDKLITEEEYTNKSRKIWLDYQKDLQDAQDKYFNGDDDGGDDTEKGAGLISTLGYTSDILESISDFTDEFIALADARIEAINREIDASNERVNSLEADRQFEWERMQAGYANNLALTEKKLADERKQREILRAEEKKSQQDKKKAADAQVAINTLLELSNLALAAAQIFTNEQKQTPGIAGVAIAIAAIALMAGAFVSFKANAKASAGYAEGVIDLDGNGTETSDSIPARLSKGESVMTAKTTKKNKRTLADMQRDPNHPLFKTINQEGVNQVWNRLTEEMSDNVYHVRVEQAKDDRVLKELKDYHSWQKDKPYSYERGGYRYTIQGNIITKAKI